MSEPSQNTESIVPSVVENPATNTVEDLAAEAYAVVSDDIDSVEQLEAEYDEGFDSGDEIEGDDDDISDPTHDKIDLDALRELAMNNSFAAMNFLQLATVAPLKLPAVPANGLCFVCKTKAVMTVNGAKQPFCTYTCKERWEASQRQGSIDSSKLVQGSGGLPNPPFCVVCKVKPPYTKDGKPYLSCGNTCSKILEQLCLVCFSKPAHVSPGAPPFVSCGITCLEKLCKGNVIANQCNYCHRIPKETGKEQCGASCAAKAKKACLMCRARPKVGSYHTCGNTCRDVSQQETPKLMDIPKGHVDWVMVENKFKAAWKVGTCPALVRVYKIVESPAFYDPYIKYKANVGNEQFTYHGTTRKCQLGENGDGTLCTASNCPACSILKTSFDVAFAKASGGFGAGIYSSTASNKAEVYTGGVAGKRGVMFLTKVAVGKSYNATAFRQVTALPAGHHSVVFNNQGGKMNETIVYSNAAIRPVFFILI